MFFSNQRNSKKIRKTPKPKEIQEVNELNVEIDAFINKVSFELLDKNMRIYISSCIEILKQYIQEPNINVLLGSLDNIRNRYNVSRLVYKVGVYKAKVASQTLTPEEQNNLSISIRKIDLWYIGSFQSAINNIDEIRALIDTLPLTYEVAVYNIGLYVSNLFLDNPTPNEMAEILAGIQREIEWLRSKKDETRGDMKEIYTVTYEAAVYISKVCLDKLTPAEKIYVVEGMQRLSAWMNSTKAELLSDINDIRTFVESHSSNYEFIEQNPLGQQIHLIDHQLTTNEIPNLSGNKRSFSNK
jgi:hypothetical protein